MHECLHCETVFIIAFKQQSWATTCEILEVTWVGCYHRHAVACLSVNVMMYHCQNYSMAVLLPATSVPLGYCVEKSHAGSHCICPIIKHNIYTASYIYWQKLLFVKGHNTRVTEEKHYPDIRQLNITWDLQTWRWVQSIQWPAVDTTHFWSISHKAFHKYSVHGP